MSQEKVFQVRNDPKLNFWEVNQEEQEKLVNLLGWEGRVLFTEPSKEIERLEEELRVARAALQGLVDDLAQSDQDGMVEHAETMRAARRALAATPPAIEAPQALSSELDGLVPDEWLSEPCGASVDDLTYGYGFKRGFNHCREEVESRIAAIRAVQPSDAPAVQVQDERAAFEESERNNSSNLSRQDDDQYENPYTQSAWEGFQAGVAYARAALTKGQK